MTKPDDHTADTALSDNESEDVFTASEPFALFEAWLADAVAKEVNDPDAMSLATVDADGLPNVRMVLLKSVDDKGFVFYTNTQSDKGREIAAHPKAALCFHWKSLQRQIRVRGVLEPVTAEEADAYFASRAKDSQIGAWASDQSRPLTGRFELEKRVALYAAKYALSKVDRPPHWSGYRVKPLSIEFWRGRPFRLHDRKRFSRASLAETNWTTEYLFP